MRLGMFKLEIKLGFAHHVLACWYTQYNKAVSEDAVIVLRYCRIRVIV